MKKYTSVFNLLARQSFYKVLILLGVMAVVEAGSFCLFGLNSTSLYRALRLSWANIAVLLGLIFLYYILILPFQEKHSKHSFTMLRLRVSRKTIGWLQSLYNVLILLLFFMVQALIVLGLGFWYSRAHGSTDPMSIFVTAHQYSLLYLVFPLGDWAGWLIRLGLVLLFGCCWAWELPLFSKSEKYVFRYPIEAQLMLQTITNDSIDRGIFHLYLLGACGIGLVVVTLIKIFGKERDEDG